MAGERMPVLFTAHGNPMNALGRTPFARFLASWRETLPRPRALLVASAHWESPRLALTVSERPETIHDFYGFPEALYALHYPAPGAPHVADRARELLAAAGLEAHADPRRGLDHGAWAPLLHLYPEADVPVAQVSLLMSVLRQHIEVGRALAGLRDEGVLILGSGNLVHNLRSADLSRDDLPAEGWAVEFDSWVRDRLLAWDLEALASLTVAAPHGRRAHPTVEHYAPLLVACGAANPRPTVSFPYEGFEHGTISMRCVRMD